MPRKLTLHTAHCTLHLKLVIARPAGGREDGRHHEGSLLEELGIDLVVVELRHILPGEAVRVHLVELSGEELIGDTSSSK